MRRWMAQLIYMYYIDYIIERMMYIAYIYIYIR